MAVTPWLDPVLILWIPDRIAPVLCLSLQSDELPTRVERYSRDHHGSHPMALILWMPDYIGTRFVSFSSVRWSPCYSGWVLFQNPPWQSPHASDSLNAWLDSHQFCAFLYRQMSSLLFRMNAISETTMASTTWFWLYVCLARLAPVLCLSLQSGELPNVWVELENSKLCFGSTETWSTFHFCTLHRLQASNCKYCFRWITGSWRLRIYKRWTADDSWRLGPR